VLVSLESTAAKYLGLYGASPDVMPRLSELARSAIVFDNAYAVYPESIKGLFSVLCSTYPSFDSSAEMYAGLPCPSIAAALAGRGYATALFHAGRFMYLGMEAIVRNRGYDRLEDAGDIGGNHASSFGVDEPSTVARILGWIDGLPKDKPFFVTYLPIAGHHPYDTPEPGPFPEGDEFGRYRNALHYGDAALGSLIDGLEARGRQQNTLWIVYGDHGEAFGQHDGNFGHTFQLYDENVRVPFLIAAPGLIPQQIRSERIVSLIDTTPTTLDLLGVPQPPAPSQGRSRLDGGPQLALFFADYSLGMLGLRDGPMKFIYELRSERAQLFDVRDDPDERRNVAGLHDGQVGEYERTLRSWSAAQKQAIRAASMER
jgi:lipoteichoic acid synthase